MRLSGVASPVESKPRLKILIMAPFPPCLDAAHGGGRVVANLTVQLARRHEVGLLYVRAPHERSVDDGLRERCAWVKEVVVDRPATRGWRQRLSTWLSLLQGNPLWVLDRASAVYRASLETVCRQWRPDIIQIEFHVMGQYLPALNGCSAPRVLTQHEPGAQAAGEASQSAYAPGRLMPHLDWLAWRCFERRVMREVQAIVVFTERDRGALLPLAPQTPIFHIPFGVTIPPVALDATGNSPLSVLFIGNFQHLPNVDAAFRLVDDIFPRVRAQFPEARLYLVGSDPPAALRQRAVEHIVVTGYVPDVTPFLDSAAVVAIPLRLGGGMRVKVLEALAAGKALVASPLAVEGLDLGDGEQVVLAETDEAFSNAIAALFDSPQQRAALARRARSWTCQNLSWERFATAYEALYQRLLMSSREALKHDEVDC